MMNSEQLQSTGIKTGIAAGSAGLSPYIEWFNDLMLSIDGLVGIYYDTVFLTFTLATGTFSAYCFFKSYRMKKKRYSEKTEKHTLEMKIMNETGQLID